MSFQDDLQKIRSKFQEAEKLEILQGETKETSEALTITLLSEFEKHRASNQNQIESNNKKIEELKKQISNIENQISEIAHQNNNISVHLGIYSNLGGMLNSSLHSFLVRAGKLKDEERRANQYKIEKEKAILAMKEAEEKAKLEAEAKARAEAKAKAEAEEKARLEIEAKAKAEAEEKAKSEEKAKLEAEVTPVKKKSKPRVKKEA